MSYDHSNQTLLQAALTSSKLNKASIHRRIISTASSNGSTDGDHAGEGAVEEDQEMRSPSDDDDEDGDDVSSDENEQVGVYTPSSTGALTPSRTLSPKGLGSGSKDRVSALSGNRPSKPLLLKLGSDPLKRFPSEIGIKIFGYLDFRALTRCQRVCRRWQKSQTLNYIWFLHYRSVKFSDESLLDLPTGKWSRKESKMEWRSQYRHLRLSPDADLVPYDPVDGPVYDSGTSTPSQRWSATGPAALSKAAARAAHKELKGRKSRDKNKTGAGRDRTGLVEEGGEGDDGRFDAPW